MKNQKSNKKQNFLIILILILISIGICFLVYTETRKDNKKAAEEPKKTLYTYIPEEEILCSSELYDITKLEIEDTNSYRISEILIKIDKNATPPETENITPNQLNEKYKNIALINENDNVVANYKNFTPVKGTNYVQLGFPISEQEFYRLSKVAEKENKKIVPVKSIERMENIKK